MEDTSKLKFRCHCGEQIAVTKPTLVERQHYTGLVAAVGCLEQAGWRWVPEHGWICPVHVEEVISGPAD